MPGMQRFPSPDGLALGQIGNVCVAIWRADASWPRFEAQHYALATVVARSPNGAAFLCVIEERSKPPDDELRKASSDMIRSHGARLKCAAGVIEASGFRGSMIRSVLAGMTLFDRSTTTPVSFFRDVKEAASWMSGHVTLQPPAFIADVERLRDSLESLRGYEGETG